MQFNYRNFPIKSGNMVGMQKKKGQNCNNSDSIRYLGTNSFFKNMKINWSRQFKFNCERHMAIANVIGFHFFQDVSL